MKFLNFQAVWLLWLVPLMILGLVWSIVHRRRKTRLLIEESLWSSVLTPWSPIKKILRQVMLVAAVFLIVLSMMRPQWGYQLREIQRKGVDLFVLLDTSQSMMAEDIKPSRMERARRELKDLLAMLHGDRIGLIPFAGQSFVSCPLTTDYDAFHLFIDQLATDLIPLQGTDIGAAILKALDSFSKEVGRSKAIILVTDGENTGDNLEEAILRATKDEVRIYTIGLGSLEGAPIPDTALGGFKKNESGQVVLSKLEETDLKQISTRTGGIYVRSVTGDMDLDQLYFKGIKDQLQESELKSEQKIMGQERFQIPLFLAVLLLLLEPFVREIKETGRQSRFSKKLASRFFKKKTVASVLLFFSFSLPLQADESTAHQSYVDGNYEKSLELYQKLVDQNPEDKKNYYNLGNAHYKQGHFDKAQQHYLSASTDSDLLIRQQSLFNLGNAAYRQNLLEDALFYYKKVLEMNPDHQKAKLNHDFVEKKLAEKKEESSQSEQNNQPDNQPENQPDDQKKETQDSQNQPASGDDKGDGQSQTPGEDAEKNKTPDQQETKNGEDQKNQEQDDSQIKQGEEQPVQNQYENQGSQDSGSPQEKHPTQPTDPAAQNQQEVANDDKNSSDQNVSSSKSNASSTGKMTEQQMEHWLNGIEDNPKNAMKEMMLKENNSKQTPSGKDW